MHISPDNLKALVSLRQELHRYPEIAFEEVETARRIVGFLKQYEPDEIVTGLGGTGVAVVYKGQSSGLRVLIRAELDALPIHEMNRDLPYVSVREGTGHKCGHDLHMAIVCGLAQIFSKTRPAGGDVILLFQPAEETGEGAARVIADPKFKALIPDYAFALHNLPEYPKGTVIGREGLFSLSVESFRLCFQGTTSHAATPHLAVSMAAILPALIEFSEQYTHAAKDDPDYLCAALTHIRTGEPSRYGTAAAGGEVEFTIRARSPDKLEDMKRAFYAHTQKHVQTYNETLPTGAEPLVFELHDGMEPFSAVVNDADAARHVRLAAEKNNLQYIALDQSNTWGEDWGKFSELDGVKAAMFGLGSETLPLHHAAYDGPDEIIEHGVRMFYEIIAAVQSE